MTEIGVSNHASDWEILLFDTSITFVWFRGRSRIEEGWECRGCAELIQWKRSSLLSRRGRFQWHGCINFRGWAQFPLWWPIKKGFLPSEGRLAKYHSQSFQPLAKFRGAWVYGEEEGRGACAPPGSTPVIVNVEITTQTLHKTTCWQYCSCWLWITLWKRAVISWLIPGLMGTLCTIGTWFIYIRIR